MTIELPTHDRQNRTTELPAFKRTGKETQMTEDQLINEASERRMRSALVEVSSRIDQMQTMGIDELIITLQETAEFIDNALGADTVFVDDEPTENVVRPAKLQHNCSWCGDPLSDWSTGIHNECRVAKGLANKPAPD